MIKRIYIRQFTTALLLGGLMFSSCSRKDTPVTPKPPVPGATFRDTLSRLNWNNDTCFVFGHKTPDVDAVTSALLYARLMNKLGYNCKAKVSSPMNRETMFASRHFGFDVPEQMSSVAPLTRLILTDHGDYSLCVDGAREAVFLQKIDHHVEGDIPDADCGYVRREMVGSTCTIIYKMFREQGMTIDDETARIMLSGIISDTRNLTKSITKPIDIEACNTLSAQLGIPSDSAAWISLQMEEAAYDYSGMADSTIFLTDYKDYDIGSHKVGFGCMACVEGEIDGFIDRMLTVAPEVMKLRDRDMLFTTIEERVPNPVPDAARLKPYVFGSLYFLYFGEGTKAAAETVLGSSLRDGVILIHEQLSRKQIVPKLIDVLK